MTDATKPKVRRRHERRVAHEHPVQCGFGRHRALLNQPLTAALTVPDDHKPTHLHADPIRRRKPLARTEAASPAHAAAA